ncbi:MAG: Apolipoprotein N-acyltransferase [Planctomycetota bacterium]
MNGSRPSPRADAALALAAVLLLWAATPPAWFVGAEFLVVPGWMATYALFTRTTRPLLWGHAVGAAHILCFSFSLRHVLLPGWVAIGIVGGCYTLLAAWFVRLRGARNGPWAWALAVAAIQWLRAHMPEMHYPHGQPCHALWEWPVLLAPVRWGGEVLLNGLVGWVSAAAVDTFRGWQTGTTPFGRARFRLAGGLAAWLLLALGARAAAAGVTDADAAPAAPVRMAAVEPGYHPARLTSAREYAEVYRSRLLDPTRELLARPEPPALVLWPESTHPGHVASAPAGEPRWEGRGWPLPELPGDTRLLVGAMVVRADGTETPAAVLLGPGGTVHGHHEKRVLVPAGEYVPFLFLLPEAAAQAVRDTVRAWMGAVPDNVFGRPQPLLVARTDAGAEVPFGAMLCFDNAFGWVGREAVADGARFLAVLSNEAWYEGGAELEQLLAMTVVRALETDTPLVRCTMDGLTAHVARDGRVVGLLPKVPAPSPGPRVLEVAVQPGPGRLPAGASLVRGHEVLLALGWLCVLWSSRRLSGTRTLDAGGS